jgi:hypothetical protein
MNGNLILILPIVIVALCAWLIFRGFKKRKQDAEPSPRKGGGTGGDEPGPP